IGANLCTLGFHGVDEGIDHCPLPPPLPEDFADLRELRDTVCRCDAMSDADQELQLYLQSDHCLVILVDVRWCRMKLLLAHLDAAIYEHTVPRHFHIIKEEHRVVLVVPACQWVVEDRPRRGFIGFA